MRKSTKVLGGLAVAGIIFAGTTASTASNTFAPDASRPVTGYAETTVSGATVLLLHYLTNGTGSEVRGVQLALQGDTTDSAVFMNFNDGAMNASCHLIGLGSMAEETVTDYTCDLWEPIATSDLNTTGVFVS